MKKMVEEWRCACKYIQQTITIHAKGSDICAVCGFNPDFYTKALIKAMQAARKEAIEEIKDKVLKDIEKYHKTYTTDMFDNGQFWEAMDIKEFLYSLLPPNKE